MRKILAVGAALFMAACTRATAETKHHRPSAVAAVAAPSQHDVDVWTYTVAANQNALAWLLDVIDWNNAIPSAPSPPAVNPVRPARSLSRAAPAARSASGGATGACGGAGANDAFIARESGGNPAAVNPTSGAFGCWQLLPSTAAGCGIGPGSSIAAQAACAARLPSSSWAASGPT